MRFFTRRELVAAWLAQPGMRPAPGLVFRSNN